MRPFRFALLGFCALAAGLSATPVHAGRPRHDEAVGRQYFTSPQANPIALSPDGSMLYVANTTSNSVQVINTANRRSVQQIDVGIEPVSVAVRPDGREVWVSNHVSDSVSVIDTDPASDTYLQVKETIQDLDANGATLFDEPVGIAFDSNTKAYVALSSRNDIAIVDATAYKVTGRIHVTAQEPRAIAVRNGLLYVAAFESGNQSQASFCINGDGQVGSLCSLGLVDLIGFITSPNLPGSVKNIVKDDALPDRDLFVYNTANDTLVTAVTGVGTLLYGLAVDASGRAFITETDARNMENGDDGTNLIDLDNRMFLDQVAATSCTASGCSAVTKVDLMPAPPAQPAPGEELSTPYGIAISGDGNTLVATSAGNSRLFTMMPDGAVQGIFDLGAGASLGQQIPRGVALASDPSGAAQTAYVLNTLENTVSVVDVSDPTHMASLTKISVGSDPTPAAIRRGAIAFSSSFASSSGTFSCASCHPDGNTDQLLWRIGGACSTDLGCNGDDEPRTTMPVRGLKNTLPLHWDGTLGDPFGGGNGAVGLNGVGGTDCTIAAGPDGDHGCFLDLANASLSGVMCDQTGACPPGGNELSAQEKDDLATFLANVAYPPARGRRLLDTISSTALEGFKDFFTNQGGQTNPDTCADSDAGCHALPLGVSTNSATLNGFDAPTMRGMTDRWIQFSIAPTAAREIMEQANAGLSISGFTSSPLEAQIQWDPANGFREETTFGTAFLAFQPVYAVRPLNILQMFEEASTEFPGATGRQVTLNTRTTTTGANLTATNNLLTNLETADSRGLVNLRGVGVRSFQGIVLSFRTDGTYKSSDDSVSLTHAQVIAEAQAGTLVATFTAALRSGYGTVLQPLLSPGSGGCTGCGDPPIPAITSTNANPPPFNVTGKDVLASATVLVDGAPATGATIVCTAATTNNCTVDLTTKPANGMHLLQARNNDGPLSEELPLCIGSATGCR